MLLEIPHHGVHRLPVYRDVVRVHPEDLRPALATRIFEAALHVEEGQVNLRVDLFLELTRVGVPAAFSCLRQLNCGGLWG